MICVWTYIYSSDQMYEGSDNDKKGFEDDEESGVVDASTMTAADFFGKPSKKLMHKYKAKHDAKVKVKNGWKGGKGGGNVKKPKAKSFTGGNDDDSWDDHNFEDDGMDWKEDDGDAEEGDDEDYDDVKKGGGASGGDQNDDDEDYKEEMSGEGREDGIARDGKRKLSAHEMRSQKLQEQTLRLERDMMAEKPWKMMGEARGTNRKVDSLLESTPEFEVAFKPPPILTPQHAADIEAMIKKRIVDEDWDDVIPRELPDIGARKRGGGEAPDVSQEKSKLGLGELYEREYLKKTTGYDRDAAERRTEEDAAKEEMRRLFANLCSQLDALSNYHFAPRPVADEADVQNREDVPAIAMEEVLPLHVSRSRGIAPEEVHAAGRGRKSVLKGESELDQVSAAHVFFPNIVRRFFFVFALLPCLGCAFLRRTSACHRLTPRRLRRRTARAGRTEAPAQRQEGGPPQGAAAKARRREADIEAPAGPRPEQSLREAQASGGAADGPRLGQGRRGVRRQGAVEGRGR